MSYSFGIFPFRMAYRQNSKTHAHTQPEYFTSKYCRWIFSDNVKLSGSGLVSQTIPSERGNSTHRNARACSWRCVCFFASISCTEGKDARYTARCVLTCGRWKLKQQLKNQGGLSSIPAYVHLNMTFLILFNGIIFCSGLLMEEFTSILHNTGHGHVSSPSVFKDI